MTTYWPSKKDVRNEKGNPPRRQILLGWLFVLLVSSCATYSSAEGKESTLPKSKEGSDVSTLPDRFPKADWLPIEAPLLSMQLRVIVKVNGKPHLAILDTGAQGTLMSEDVADALGVTQVQARTIRILDAHGNQIPGERRTAKHIQLGNLKFDDVTVNVLKARPGLFLVGQDLLEKTDLFIAGDEGLIGIFAPGTAPKLKGAVAANLIRGRRQLQISGSAPSVQDVPVDFKFILDTGAMGSSVPVMLGANKGLPAELRYGTTTISVGSEEESRGRFLLNPLSLGSVQEATLGRVLVLGGTMQHGEGLGLLGNDVLMRFYTVISTYDGEVRFAPMPWRPSYRIAGPGGKPCLDDDGKNVKCIEVKFAPARRVPKDALPGVCLSAKVHKAYAGQTVELAIVAYSKKRQTLFNGGALRVFLSVGQKGEEKCFSLWKALSLLDVDKDSLLSLRFVRTEHIRWPCDPMQTTCISFTGPLPKLGLRDDLRP
ncbi:MAG: hypothetical protein GY822_31745 [Deltaproteobacteria bacterium]|nr:hypothetical protein [Deltaproteobacteria bacterium]